MKKPHNAILSNPVQVCNDIFVLDLFGEQSVVFHKYDICQYFTISVWRSLCSLHSEWMVWDDLLVESAHPHQKQVG